MSTAFKQMTSNTNIKPLSSMNFGGNSNFFADPTIGSNTQEENMRDGEVHRLRLLPEILTLRFHVFPVWFEKSGMSTIKRPATNWDPVKCELVAGYADPYQELIESGGVYHYSDSHDFYFNAISRRVQYYTPAEQILLPSPEQLEATNGILDINSNFWTPVRSLRLPQGAANSVADLAKFHKVGIPTPEGGMEIKEMDVVDLEYGCDLDIFFDRNAKNVSDTWKINMSRDNDPLYPNLDPKAPVSEGEITSYFLQPMLQAVLKMRDFRNGNQILHEDIPAIIKFQEKYDPSQDPKMKNKIKNTTHHQVLTATDGTTPQTGAQTTPQNQVTPQSGPPINSQPAMIDSAGDPNATTHHVNTTPTTLKAPPVSSPPTNNTPPAESATTMDVNQATQTDTLSLPRRNDLPSNQGQLQGQHQERADTSLNTAPTINNVDRANSLEASRLSTQGNAAPTRETIANNSHGAPPAAGTSQETTPQVDLAPTTSITPTVTVNQGGGSTQGGTPTVTPSTNTQDGSGNPSYKQIPF